MARYRGKKVKLNQPFRTSGGSKKFGVYVKNQRTGNVNLVRFGDPKMSIKRKNPARRKSFNARMSGVLKGVRGQKSLSPAYWSLKAWQPSAKFV